MRRGFTMMEVLIALAIFVGAAVMLGASYLGVLTAYAQIEHEGDYRNEIKFARATLMAEPDFDTAEKGGDFEAANGRRVTWKATIEPTSSADLFTVNFECEINGAELKEPVRTTQSFRLLRPTWSKAEDRDKLRADARTRILELQQNQSK
ncbi:MAG: prepilin-type N-terminal cleavage/methylation domain-containing protein [Verrucomicrobia bacterium]|nr:prepilin-type N-terminal cleavage/methylation domain-containing protein [Verrucomicrobiota bacterium]